MRGAECTETLAVAMMALLISISISPVLSTEA